MDETLTLLVANRDPPSYGAQWGYDRDPHAHVEVTVTRTGVGQLAWWCGAMRGVVWLALLCCLGGAAPVWGETPPPALSPTVACANAQTTAAMRECELARYQLAEAGMTAAYHRLMTQLDARGRAKLQHAQQAWRTFRDAEAAFQANALRGGTLAPLIRASVLADMTESRWQQLMKEVQALGQ